MCYNFYKNVESILKKRYILLFALALLSLTLYFSQKKEREPIRVGVLFSQSGTMKFSEKPLIDATLFAIDKINRDGGILGREVIPIVLDGKSNPKVFQQRAKELIKEHRVSVIFGCWTSSSRVAVREVVEKYNSLLFYPLQYEGLEESENIIYTGLTPNQQIIPVLQYARENFGDRFFLVGSNYIYPKVANLIIKEQLQRVGSKVLDTEYIELGAKSLEHIVYKIEKTEPDIIINNINGDSNIALFRELKSNPNTKDIPTISFSITEGEVNTLKNEIDSNIFGNDYLSWSYFESIPTDKNREFLKEFKEIYGEQENFTDPMEAIYFGVYLYKKAIEKSQTTEVDRLKYTLKGLSVAGLSGVFYIDSNNHSYKNIKIAKVKKNGEIEIVWDSVYPIEPKPFPDYRTKSEWLKILEEI